MAARKARTKRKKTATNGAAKPNATAKARTVLRKADEKRARDCGKEVAAILKKFNCRLEGVPAFVPAGAGGVFAVAVKVQIATNKDSPDG